MWGTKGSDWSNAGKGAAKGALAGSMTPLGPGLGTVVGAIMGDKKVDDYGSHIAQSLGFDNRKGKDAMNDLQGSTQAQNKADRGILDQMKGADKTALNNQQTTVSQQKSGYQDNVNKYIDNLSNTKMDLQGQKDDATKAYSNTVMPNLQNLMQSRQDNASNAMSLKDAQDPNNSVATGVRGMYNTQAQGIQNQGLADYGVLAALGSQASAGQMGNGMPMTGGQMMAMQNANMGQASGAFANAQNTANSMKLQGMQAGQDQSNWAYNAGQAAQDSYRNSIGDYAQAEKDKLGLQDHYTGEMSGIDGQTYGLNQSVTANNFSMDTGMNSMRAGTTQDELNRDMAQTDKEYGGQQALDAAQIQAANSAQQGKLGALGTIAGGAAGYFTGGAGGAAGAAGAAGGAGGAAGGGSTMNNVGTGASIGSSIFQGGFGTPAPVTQPYGSGGYQGGSPYGQAPAYGGQQGPYRPGGY